MIGKPIPIPEPSLPTRWLSALPVPVSPEEGLPPPAWPPLCCPAARSPTGFGAVSWAKVVALFATGAEPAELAKPKMAGSIPDDTAELVWQAAESLYTVGSCLREGEDPFGPMADAARALHRVADRFPVLLTLTAGGRIRAQR